MNRFGWKWYLTDLQKTRDVKVFSTFSCCGGSSMGYKRAGFEVLGNVEIDPKINKMYCVNNHPKYNFCMDLRQFNKLEDLPEELFDLDILDGSPPCTSFSFAGDRDKTWGKEKKFREGQKHQKLDDLFFVFLDTVERLRPKIVIAENVVGLVSGKAKGYVNQIVKRFHELGYAVQIFKLNSAFMDVPQARHRVFFVANRLGFAPLSLSFNYDPILFKEVRSAAGKPVAEGTMTAKMLAAAKPGDAKLMHVAQRVAGGLSYYGQEIVGDEDVCRCVTSGGALFRFCDKMAFSDEDIVAVQTFPQDYDFCGNSVQYVCGMSVPPNMMANVAEEVYEQWLK